MSGRCMILRRHLGCAELKGAVFLGSVPMPTDPPKAAEHVVPVITPERARELVREGAEAARAYRQRVARMWAISKDARQTRAR